MAQWKARDPEGYAEWRALRKKREDCSHEYGPFEEVLPELFRLRDWIGENVWCGTNYYDYPRERKCPKCGLVRTITGRLSYVCPCGNPIAHGTAEIFKPERQRKQT